MPPAKTCAVCGDKALGFNFNAITCESCKAFFRRNALSKKKFSCPFNQNCQITLVTRRFCQKCRLEKCLAIGMKAENIMSEEDRLLKRRKIEDNRLKRKQREKKRTEVPLDAEAQCDDNQSNASFDSTTTCSNNNISSGPSSVTSPLRSVSRTSHGEITNIEVLTSTELVEIIVSDPDRASQAISSLMRSKEDALYCIEKVLSSQVDALRLISHLIAYPGDALKIISKIMNSPFNALTVFTKFMSSPTDALEIISKVVDSPQDVVQFIRNLMNSPEDALEIIQTFMTTPAEALRMLNRILSSTHAMNDENANAKETVDQPPPPPPQPQQQQEPPQQSTTDNNNSTIIQSILASNPYETEQLNYLDEGMIAMKSTNLSKNDINISNDQYMRQMMQQVFGDGVEDGNFNSLDSVLAEIIRMEYFSCNNNVLDLHVKQEQAMFSKSCFNDGYVIQQQHHSNNNDNMDQPYGQSYDNPADDCNGIKMNSPMSCFRPLNEPEKMKLYEIQFACKALYDPIEVDTSLLDVGDDRIKPHEMHHKFVSLINLTSVAIKRLIKMSKKISAFRNMCQEDQVALLKGGCTEMMIMRSVMTFDMNANTWKVLLSSDKPVAIRADLIKMANLNLYEEILKFNSTFDEKWRSDENIILLLCTIVLFMPSRANVVHKDVIKLEQNSYYYLLRRYLETIYRGCEAKSTFMKLVQKVTDVARLNDVITNVYLNVNPMQMEPLIREIFDIKPHCTQ